MSMPNMPSDRPYSTPPTNVENSNDYTGIDRGLFLTRDLEPKYVRVINAEWTTYGPACSPGILKVKLGVYETKPETPDDYNDFTFLTTSTGDEWFEVTTSGPTHKAILVEYWAKFIYYNYYVLKPIHTKVSTDTALVNSIKETGDGFTRALVPGIKSVENKAIYSIAHGQPLSISSYTSTVEPMMGQSTIKDLTEQARNSGDRFDPVITVSKML